MATVGKKFTSPDKWETGWFSRLSPQQKILYTYMWDRCDHSGVLEFIPPVWGAHIGYQVDQESLVELMEIVNRDKERVAIFGDKVWLVQYIRFQQQPDPTLPIKSGHPLLPKIVRLLKEHGLYEELKKRDPVIFQAYEEQNGDSSTSKASHSLGQASGESLSRSRSAGNSGSNSDSGSTSPDSKKEIDINNPEIFGEPSIKKDGPF